jgi:predicted aconitase with swiveling domain
MKLAAESLIDGEAEGEVLLLGAPISFWGGVDPATGRITAAKHPDRGANIAGKILVVGQTIGSSSSSAILLELLRTGRAPAALVLAEIDPILTLGVVVAREMGYATIPVLCAAPAPFETGMRAHIGPGGRIELGAP